MALVSLPACNRIIPFNFQFLLHCRNNRPVIILENFSVKIIGVNNIMIKLIKGATANAISSAFLKHRFLVSFQQKLLKSQLI